jgi:FkbM family methyltransferase
MGVYSIRAGQKVGPSGRVLAFEPLPTTVARLNRNISYNKLNNITVIDVAIGDHEGETTLYEGGRQSSASLCRLTAGPSHNVHMKTIDAVVRQMQLPRIDWVKLDIEGAEPAALSGMKETLARFRPSILFENGDAAKVSIALLQRCGYRIGQYDRQMNWHCTETGANLFARPS